MSLTRATGSQDKDIVCRNCAHMKHWHDGEGACFLPDDDGIECDCEAWDYGVNVRENLSHFRINNVTSRIISVPIPGGTTDEA
jgi:hypothetical protein